MRNSRPPWFCSFSKPLMLVSFFLRKRMISTQIRCQDLWRSLCKLWEHRLDFIWTNDFIWRSCYCSLLHPFFLKTLYRLTLLITLEMCKINNCFLLECLQARALQATSAYKRRKLWLETHTPLWLLIVCNIFVTRDKTSFAPLIGQNSFAKKSYNIALQWAYPSMYNI